MSDIIRYHMMWNKDEDGSIYVSPWPCFRSGDWVKYEDYARLKAEVDEARRGSGAGMGVMLDLNNQLVAENARLKADVERLRKAGDAVCESPYVWETDPAVIEWRAAKEGKPSV